MARCEAFHRSPIIPFLCEIRKDCFLPLAVLTVFALLLAPNQVSWHPKGNAIASCGGDRAVRVWAPNTPSTETCNADSAWTCCHTLDGAHKRTVRGVSFSPDGRCIASASFDATTGIWEKDQKGGGDFECVATLEGHENEAKSVAWSASGSLLATCSRDKSVWIWEVEADNDFECLSVLQEHTQDVKMVTWHPNEELLASASYDDTIKMWCEEDDDWYCSDTLIGHQSTVWSVDFDQSGNNLVSCGDDKTIRFWRRYKPGNKEGVPTPDSRTSKWKLITTLSDAHERCIYSISWSKEHGRVASAGSDATIKIIEMEDDAVGIPVWKTVAILDKPHGTSDVNSVSWNPDPAKSDLLATGGDDGIVRIWRLVL